MKNIIIINIIYYQISDAFSDITYMINSINLNKMRIRTDKGILFKKIKDISSFIYSQNEKVVAYKGYENLSSLILGTYYFYINNDEDVYERKYLKIQDEFGKYEE